MQDFIDCWHRSSYFLAHLLFRLLNNDQLTSAHCPTCFVVAFVLVLQCFFYSFSQSGFPLPLSSSIERPTRDERAQSIQLQFCVTILLTYWCTIIDFWSSNYPSSPRQRVPSAVLRRLDALVLFVPVIIPMIYNNSDLTHQFHGKLFPYSLIHTYRNTQRTAFLYLSLFHGPSIFPNRTLARHFLFRK